MKKLKIKLLVGRKEEEYEELKGRDTARPPEPAALEVLLGMFRINAMVCPACGNKAYPCDKFCSECGQRFV